jgi:DNA-binding transcriptional LysR family regulator
MFCILIMRMTNITRVDLNLLAPLAALLDERHVSRAAQRVGLSQPAMSRALQRLRATLGDELLVRDLRGYQLTPRAERIRGQLLAIMPTLDILFAAEIFDPPSAKEEFRLVGSDYAALLFGPALFQRVFQQSPHSTLRFEAWHDAVFGDLERGAIDLVFYAVAPPPGFRVELLFEERFVCLMSRDHPLADHERITLDDYLGCSHIVINILGGQTVIDRQLETLGTPRRASLTVPYHAAAEMAVPGTMLVATLPERLVSPHVNDPVLRIVLAPIEIQRMSYLMAWHPRLDDDPAQRWLRDMIRSVTATL